MPCIRDELTTLANILIAPPLPFLPEAAHGQTVVTIVGVYAGSARVRSGWAALALLDRLDDAIDTPAGPARRRAGARPRAAPA
jgi:hypothetical protein